MMRQVAQVIRSKAVLAICSMILILGCGGALAACSSARPLSAAGSDPKVQGTIASIDSSGSSFVLKVEDGTTVTVVTDNHTEFEGTVHTFADLKVGLRVEVKGAVQENGSIVAARVEAEEDEEGDQVELTGTIDSIDATRSSFVLTLGDGTKKTIHVSGQTAFEEGLQRFADLKIGLRVEVEGALEADGSVNAARVKAEDENEDAQQEENRVELTGTIDSIDAAHSSFVLKLANGAKETVVVSRHTAFDSGFHSFADLKTGMRIEVRGALQANGSIAATRVHREDDDHDGHGGDDGDHGGGDGDHGGDDGHSGDGR